MFVNVEVLLVRKVRCANITCYQTSSMGPRTPGRVWLKKPGGNKTTEMAVWGTTSTKTNSNSNVI